jgi:hypothetical protein
MKHVTITLKCSTAIWTHSVANHYYWHPWFCNMLHN